MVAPRYHVDEGLTNYATETQKKYLEAVNQHRGYGPAAKALKVSPSTVRDAIYCLEKKAALCGYAPEHDMRHAVPAPFVVKGVSTYYDDKGKVKGQWVKSKLDNEQSEEAIRDFIGWLAKDAKGLSPLVVPPRAAFSDLLAVYPFGDPHLGMYAWAKETGEDFDLETAERLTLGAVDSLVASSPPAETAILLPLGDVFHADDQTNQTPGHKNQLDVDSRYPKVISVGIKTFRHAVLRALEKHEKVIVRIEPGNHDPHAKWALVYALAAYFENNPRVEIDQSPSKFWYYKFHSVLLGTTHGDTVKPDQLPGIMAADRAEDWGTTKHRYWFQGHIHTHASKEYPGVIWEAFRTLAAKDAWTAGHGYRAGRDMRAIIFHKEFGEIARNRCDISMLEAV
jgi:hypothetical protein